MLKSSVHADTRNEVGTSPSNRVRNNGHVPGVLYGYNIEPANIEVDQRELNSIIRHYGVNALVNVEVNGDDMTAMIKDVQREPIRNEIIHVDFQAVSYNKPIHASVPVVLVDKDGIKSMGTTVQHQLRSLEVECLPQDIPENVQISVKNLSLGNPLKIADVEFAEDFTVLNSAEEVIASLAHIENVIDDEGEDKDLLDEDITNL